MFDVATEYDKLIIPSSQYHSENVLKETPRQILSREYLVYKGIPYSDFDFYPLTVLIPFQAEFLKTFRYLRCGFKLRFEQHTTPQHYGVSVISWLPEFTANADYQVINANPTLLDMSSTETFEINIPFISVFEAYPIAVGNGDPTAGPHVFFKSLFKEFTDSSIAQPTFSIYMSLIEPEIFGAVSQSGVLTTTAEDFISMSDFTPSTLATAGIRTLSAVYPKATIAVNAAKVTSSVLQYAWDRYAQSETSSPAINETPQPVRNQAFGDLAGCVYSPNLQMVAYLPSFKQPYHLGETRMSHKIKDMIQIPTIKQYLSFSSVSADAYTELIYEPFTTPDDPTYFNSYYDEISNLFRFWRGSIKMRLIFYTSPLISASFKIYWFNRDGNTTATNFTKIATDCYSRVIQVRGTTSIDVELPYVSSRPYDSLAPILTGIATKPKLSTLYIRNVSNPTQVGDVTGKVCLVTIVSAGPDFQFKDLRSMQPTAISQMNLASTWSGDFQNIARGSNMYQYYEDLAEDYLTLEDISRRYSTRIPTGGLRLSSSSNTLFNIDGFDWIQGMFRFVRGSICIKYLVPPTEPITFPTVGMSSNIPTVDPQFNGKFFAMNGIASNSVNQNSVLEFEVPFQANTNWDYVRFRANNSRPGATFLPFVTPPYTDLTATPSRLYVSGGRDYQIAFLMPPRVVDMYPVWN